MGNEKQFTKYESRSADYHYYQINKRNLKKFNAFTEARYIKHINLINSYFKTLNFDKNKTIKVLDVGCGDGVLLYLLKRKITDCKFQIYGVDLSEKALEVAKNKIPAAKFSKTEVYNTNLQDNSFDLIISSDVIEHVNYAGKMLEEIKRLAKKDALIIIGTPIRCTEKPLDPMHVKEFFQQEFIDLCSSYFSFIKLEESHKQIHFLTYIKRTRFSNIGLNRYRYNILSIFGNNPFLKPIKTKNDFPTYMFAVCKA